ncbi:uncharacterized protein LOC128180181 [Crassostrea angulata]|uniref:uncharacterized protein LOC128180181 n=1 Tax=Magallana angulata TaxID=2784310 RepID=UPI0022B193BD|nr:uncharacterized protein LOC128180181 [Crassostrea angulata]
MNSSYILLIIWGLLIKEGIGCLEWISSADGRYRRHCYSFIRSPSPMNTLEADDYCRLTTGGRLAPYIDSFQYNHLLSLRPADAATTFIGTNDIALEDTWVNFDGTPIHNNGFIYTMTNYPVDQPNGGAGQNCAVINAKPGDATYIPSETQDKSCTTHSSTDMLCYNEEYTGQCLSWTSTADSKYRSHCYWLTSTPGGATDWRVTDAMTKCQCEGGQLAPVIDDLQFAFLTNLLSTISGTTGVATSAWFSNHNIKGTPANWNGDPSTASFSSTPPAGEYCFLTSTGGTQTWQPCSYTDIANINGAICYTEALAAPVPVTSNVSAMTIEERKKELTIDPKETNAFKLSKISVYEDRPTAKGIGILGIALLGSFFAFIIVLDCQRLEQFCSRKTDSTSA